MLERLSWRRLVLELPLYCPPIFVLGAFFGYLPWSLLASVTGLLIWYFWNLLCLSWQLWVDRNMTPPLGCDSWEPPLYGLHQMQLRNRKRRHELSNLIRRFHSGAESLPNVVVLTMEEGGIFRCNSLARQILGLRWPEDSGQNIPNLLRYPEFTQYLKTRDFSHPLSLVLNTGRHLEVHIMPCTHKQLLIVARSATRAHQPEEARRNFFVNMSHELRTPLTVLQGYLEMMGKQPLEGAVRERMSHTICEQTQRVEGLVKQLLTLPEIEAASTQLLSEKVDVPMMLRIVEHEAQALSRKKQTFTFEIDNGLKVSGSGDQLYSAISNLAYNVVNHAPEDTHITIYWQRVPHGAEFSVEDNGPGTAPEHIPRLTERFYRAGKARSRQTGGNGLGLAIARHAVSRHESCLNIESTTGKGTRSNFVIPERLITKNSD